MDAEDLSYDVDSRIDTTTLSKNLRRVKVKGVRERGERFCASLKLVNNMMILPRVLLSIGHLGRVMAFYETKAAILATLSQEREDDY
jgi:hypothetical protein